MNHGYVLSPGDLYWPAQLGRGGFRVKRRRRKEEEAAVCFTVLTLVLTLVYVSSLIHGCSTTLNLVFIVVAMTTKVWRAHRCYVHATSFWSFRLESPLDVGFGAQVLKLIGWGFI